MDVTTASPRRDLVIGIDGGGTSTIAFLAEAATGDILGRGVGGPSNIQSVGVEAAFRALEQAINAAFSSAQLPRSRVAAAVMGLAGIDRNEGLDIILNWADRIELARTVEVANDATLLLAAGTPQGWGLAVIAGTGSIAFTRTPEGVIGRCGGWGHLLGDEGSAFQLALSGLRAACRAYDGIHPATTLVDRFVAAMKLAEAPEFIPAVYRGDWDRSAIAGLAPIVLEAAIDGDATALEIVRRQARELSATAAGAVRAAQLPTEGLPVALAGGVITKSEAYREEFLGGLLDLGIRVGSVQLVSEPAQGAVVLARAAAAVSSK